MNKKYIFLGFIFFAGCYSLSTYHTADTTPPGKINLGGGFTFYGAGVQGKFAGIGPIPEIFGRYGITENFDAGMTYTLPLTISGNMKWQVLKEDYFSAAVIPSWTFCGCMGGEGCIGFLFLHPSILFTIKSGGSPPFMNFYFGPKILHLSVLGRIPEKTEVVTHQEGVYFGGVVGAKIYLGKRLAVMPEITALLGVGAIEKGTSIFQGGVGFAFEF